MYKKESKISIIIFSVSAIVISEMLQYVFNVFHTGTFVNVFTFILIILKQSIINVCLAYVLFLIFKLCKQEG